MLAFGGKSKCYLEGGTFFKKLICDFFVEQNKNYEKKNEWIDHRIDSSFYETGEGTFSPKEGQNSEDDFSDFIYKWYVCNRWFKMKKCLRNKIRVNHTKFIYNLYFNIRDIL